MRLMTKGQQQLLLELFWFVCLLLNAAVVTGFITSTTGVSSVVVVDAPSPTQLSSSSSSVPSTRSMILQQERNFQLHSHRISSTGTGRQYDRRYRQYRRSSGCRNYPEAVRRLSLMEMKRDWNPSVRQQQQQQRLLILCSSKNIEDDDDREPPAVTVSVFNSTSSIEENEDATRIPIATIPNDNNNNETMGIIPSETRSSSSNSSNNTATRGGDTNNENSSSSSSSWIWKVVLPLWLVYISNQWSRSSIYYLVNFDSSTTTTISTIQQQQLSTAMNLEIGFDETQYGILASVAFTSLFAITSLAAGLLSDRYNRKLLTVASVIGWTVATYGTATSTTYDSIVVWRIAMGFACAFSTPTAYTLLRDSVPSTRQAIASSLYGTGVALGSGLASYTLVLDTMYGWRQALDIIASAGLIATLLTVVLLPDDNKGIPNTATTLSETSSLLNSSLKNDKDDIKIEEIPFVESIINDVQKSFATDRAKWIYIGSFVRFCSGLCIGVWGAPYFRMTFSDHVNEYAYTQAAISAIGASISGIAGGAIADQLSSTPSPTTTTTAATTIDTSDGVQDNDRNTDDDLIGRRLWVPVIGSLLAAPAWYMAIHSPDSFEVSMAWLATEYLVAECWFGPTISTLQTTVGSKIGGTAQGLFTLTGAIANFAPSILGYLYGQAISSSGTNDGVGDAVVVGSSSSSSTELANLLTIAVCFGYIANAFCFGMAANAKSTGSIGNNMSSSTTDR